MACRPAMSAPLIHGPMCRRTENDVKITTSIVDRADRVGQHLMTSLPIYRRPVTWPNQFVLIETERLCSRIYGNPTMTRIAAVHLGLMFVA